MIKINAAGTVRAGINTAFTQAAKAVMHLCQDFTRREVFTRYYSQSPFGRRLGGGNGFGDISGGMGQTTGEHPFFQGINRPPLGFGFLKESILIDGCAEVLGQILRQIRNHTGGQNDQVGFNIEPSLENRLQNHHLRAFFAGFDPWFIIHPVLDEDHTGFSSPGEIGLGKPISHHVAIENIDGKRGIFFLEMQGMFQGCGTADPTTVITGFFT